MPQVREVSMEVGMERRGEHSCKMQQGEHDKKIWRCRHVCVCVGTGVSVCNLPKPLDLSLQRDSGET